MNATLAPLARASVPANPFRGLEPFTERDAEYFAGRERDTRKIIAKLRASRLTVLYGPSGVGKTSVLRAGVARTLRKEAAANEDLYGAPLLGVVVFDQWHEQPLARLCAAIAKVAAGSEPGEPDGAGLPEAIRACSARLGRSAPRDPRLRPEDQAKGELFIVLDQFEQFFLYHPGPPREGEFLAQLASAINHPDLCASFLISIREDWLARLDVLDDYVENLYDDNLRLDHLDVSGARRAIEKPVSVYNGQAGEEGAVKLEDGFVESILSDRGLLVDQNPLSEEKEAPAAAESSGRARVTTAFLQLVLTRIWEHEVGRGSRSLRKATLKTLGGAEKIIEQHVLHIMGALSWRERGIAAKVFPLLIVRGLKVARSVRELAESLGNKEQLVQRVLDKLAHPERRLLRQVSAAPSHPREPRFEVPHDVLGETMLRWTRSYNLSRRNSKVIRGGILAGLTILALTILWWRSSTTAAAYNDLLLRFGLTRQDLESSRLTVSLRDASIQELKLQLLQGEKDRSSLSARVDSTLRLLSDSTARLVGKVSQRDEKIALLERDTAELWRGGRVLVNKIVSLEADTGRLASDVRVRDRRVELLRSDSTRLDGLVERLQGDTARLADSVRALGRRIAQDANLRNDLRNAEAQLDSLRRRETGARAPTDSASRRGEPSP